MFVIALPCLPETLYVRSEVDSPAYDSRPKYSKTIFVDSLKIRDRDPIAPLRWDKFIIPTFRLIQKPRVIFPALYYATQYGFASILPAVTVASIFNKEFGWDTLQIGLGYGGALTIGGSLGELAAGLVLDAIVKTTMKKNGDFVPEMRLRAIWHGEILVPTGLLVYGFTMQYKTFWVGPLMGMGTCTLHLEAKIRDIAHRSAKTLQASRLSASKSSPRPATPTQLIATANRATISLSFSISSDRRSVSPFRSMLWICAIELDINLRFCCLLS